MTYYTKVAIQTAEGPRDIPTPETKPLATCHQDLEPDEIEHLLRLLVAMARKRGMDAAAICKML